LNPILFLFDFQLTKHIILKVKKSAEQAVVHNIHNKFIFHYWNINTFG